MITGQRSRKKASRGLALLAAAILATTVGTAYALDLPIDTERHTTLEQVLMRSGANNPECEVGGGNDPTCFDRLQVDDIPDGQHVVRDGPNEGNQALPAAQPGRDQRRKSLAYFAQMTDFQLADEESPARVEFLDNPMVASAWRPMEAFTPLELDASIKQVNRFVPASPVQQGNGINRRMDFALMTGDQADNQQLNETIWVRELLEGSANPLNFNSGTTDPAEYTGANALLPGCGAAADPTELARLIAEAPKYTGVQDYDDYDHPVPQPDNPAYYDPDTPQGVWDQRGFPTWMGLMDRAQQAQITPEGLDVPAYITNGNHDVLMQGNEDANRAFEDIAIGCLKALSSTAQPAPGAPDLSTLLSPNAFMTVPRDDQRQIVDKLQIKEIYEANDPDGHGFKFVDPAEEQASKYPFNATGSASYYAWDPPETPGFRFISIDTTSEGGIVEQSSSGNIDDPQFQWLKRELDAAQAANKLIVIFGHHPVRSLASNARDEAAPACTSNDDPPHSHGHDHNPGCDPDPRPSEPIHLGSPNSPQQQGVAFGQSFTELLQGYSNVIAYVAGHTHENKLIPFTRPNNTAWWEINTAAVIDWPQQSRLIEVMDNKDGTLSIFATILDHASPATAPAADPVGTAVANYGGAELASIGRTLAFNDPQSGAPDGEGAAADQNVEMLLFDPRGLGQGGGGGPGGGGAGGGGAGAAGQGQATGQAQPSNQFGFPRVKLNKKKGIAFVTVKVPGLGEVGLEGKGLKSIGLGPFAQKSVAVERGLVKLKVKPAKKGKLARKIWRRLKPKGKAKVKVRVTYLPRGGVANTKVRKVTLIRK